jgi:catechol 2,3-dioxygenase-like lactoylglutathione lyase family enzyme
MTPFSRIIAASLTTKGVEMIDHVAFYVSDLEVSRSFYEQALAPFGYGVAFEMEGMVAFGPGSRPRLALRVGEEPSRTGHVAIEADDHATVDAFYAAAMAAGGSDNGAPGIREHYHPTYYAAFVHDPDGNNVEAVSWQP